MDVIHLIFVTSVDRQNAVNGFDSGSGSFAHLFVQYHSHRFVAMANQILVACLKMGLKKRGEKRNKKEIMKPKSFRMILITSNGRKVEKQNNLAKFDFLSYFTMNTMTLVLNTEIALRKYWKQTFWNVMKFERRQQHPQRKRMKMGQRTLFTWQKKQKQRLKNNMFFAVLRRCLMTTHFHS